MEDLTPETLARLWESDVRPQLFEEATPSDQPVLVLLGGQPGAGKTRANRLVSAGMHGHQSVTTLLVDDLRQFHPRYDELMDTDPLAMPDATAAAAGRWLEMSIDHALAHGYSILIEGTWRVPQIPLDTVELAASEGYDVHAVALAVQPAVSRLATLARYYQDVRAGLPARWTPPAAHDEAVRNAPVTLRRLADDPRVSRVTVVTRDAVVLADLVDPPTPDGHRGAAALAALEHGMNRPLTAAEATTWLRSSRDLRAAHSVHTPAHYEAVLVWEKIQRHDTPAIEAIAHGTRPPGGSPGASRGPARGNHPTR